MIFCIVSVNYYPKYLKLLLYKPVNEQNIFINYDRTYIEKTTIFSLQLSLI